MVWRKFTKSRGANIIRRIIKHWDSKNFASDASIKKKNFTTGAKAPWHYIAANGSVRWCHINTVFFFDDDNSRPKKVFMLYRAQAPK